MNALTINSDNTSKIIELPIPKPGKGEVLVKVKFSALDTAASQVLRRTWVGSFIHAQTNPLIVGWHFSGIVVEVDDNINEPLKVGDAVWGHLQYEPSQKQGAFCEYICVKADACALQPKDVSLEQCAAASTEFGTALQAMRDVGGLEEDMDVLIVGAAGGVGSAAVGIAKTLGAHVTAICSSKDVARVQALGADRVLNKSQDPYADGHLYHVIFDVPNVFSSRESLSHLHRGGSYVSTLPSWSWLGGYVVSWFTSKKVAMVEVKSNKKDLDQIGEWLRDGLTECCKVDSQYAIKDMTQALARQEERSKIGRVVVKVEGGW